MLVIISFMGVKVRKSNKSYLGLCKSVLAEMENQIQISHNWEIFLSDFLLSEATSLFFSLFP